MLKRTSAVTVTDPEEFCKLEFWDRERKAPDLALSVYAAAREEATAVFAEHAASANLDPPRAGALVDLGDAGEAAEVRPAPRAGYFARTDGGHRELHFPDDEAVRAYVERVRSTLAARLVPVPRNALTQYVRARLAAADPEWSAFVAGAAKGERWR